MATITVINLKRVRRMFKDLQGYSKIPYSMNQALKNYRTALVKKIRSEYATRQTAKNIDRLMIYRRATKSKWEAALVVRYKAHPLSEFIVSQVAITTRKRKKKVTSSRKGLGFKKQLGSGKPYTKVVVVKGSPYKLVQGKYGYKGFLQHKKRQIYERKQHPTWYGKIRAPYYPLYGLSISQMARARRVQTNEFKKYGEFVLDKEIGEALKKTFR